MQLNTPHKTLLKVINKTYDYSAYSKHLLKLTSIKCHSYIHCITTGYDTSKYVSIASLQCARLMRTCIFIHSPWNTSIIIPIILWVLHTNNICCHDLIPLNSSIDLTPTTLRSYKWLMHQLDIRFWSFQSQFQTFK